MENRRTLRDAAIFPVFLRHKPATQLLVRATNTDIVLHGLLGWIRKERSWTRAHRLATVGHTLCNRVVHKTRSQQFVSADISDTQLEVWIYPDQINLGGGEVDKRFEEWDAASPAELIEIFCQTMLKHLGSSETNAT
jgi:hypothetical protein